MKHLPASPEREQPPRGVQVRSGELLLHFPENLLDLLEQL